MMRWCSDPSSKTASRHCRSLNASRIAGQLSELDGTGAVNYVTEFKWRQLNLEVSVQIAVIFVYPGKTNMEPENISLENEKHLQNLQFLGYMSVCEGVSLTVSECDLGETHYSPVG